MWSFGILTGFLFCTQVAWAVGPTCVSSGKTSGEKNLTPLPPTTKVKSAIEKCQQELVQSKCTQYFEKHADEREHQRVCTAEKMIEDAIGPHETQACFLGAGKFFWDTSKQAYVFTDKLCRDAGKTCTETTMKLELAKKIARWISSNYQTMAQRYKENADTLEICNRDIKCKRQLVRGIPSFDSLSDIELDAFNAADLLPAKGIPIDKLAELETDFYSTAFDPKKDYSERHLPPSSNIIYNYIVSEYQKADVRMNCLDSYARRELLCYGLTALAAPGVIVKGARYLSATKTLDRVVEVKAFRYAGNEQELKGKIVLNQEAVNPGRNERQYLNHIREENSSAQGREARILSKERRKVERDSLVKRYKNDVFTAKDNQAYDEIAAKWETGKLKGEHLEFEMNNSWLKECNKIDFELCTALTNSHKKKLLENMNALLGKYQKQFPNLKFYKYGDHKGASFIFENGGAPLPKELEEELLRVANKTHEQFLPEAQKFFSREESRGPKKPKDDIDNWYMPAMSRDPGGAAICARISRNLPIAWPCRYSDPAIQAFVTGKREAAIRLNNELINTVGRIPGVMTTHSFQGQSVTRLSEEVLSVLRKNSDLDVIRKQVSLELKIKPELTREDAQRMLKFYQESDVFSPNIRIVERESPSLANFENDAIYFDRVGMGALNAAATADGVLVSRNVSEAIRHSRTAEIEATRLFKVENEAKTKLIKEAMPERQFAQQIGGDDQMFGDTPLNRVTPKPLTLDEKMRVAQRLANNVSLAPQNTRAVFVSSEIPKDIKQIVGTHGQDIIKEMTQNLKTPAEILSERAPVSAAVRDTTNRFFSTTIEPEKLKGLTPTVSMPNSPEYGSIDLIVGVRQGVKISPQQQRDIEASFRKAIATYNEKKLGSREMRTDYSVGRIIFTSP